MAFVVDDNDTSLADVSKQATKALKCVASTSKQVSDLLARKHERIIKRICSISEEIESLKNDVMENIAHQRERRLQLSEIEEDIDQAQLLGNGTIVEELLEELHVLKDETNREDTLYRALGKTVRSRKATRNQFLKERAAVEEEIRNFECKQKLIQTLLATCSKQSSSSVDTQGSSASSQSDCGASALGDEDEEGSNSTGSESPLDAAPQKSTAQANRETWLAKSVSLDAPARAASPSKKQSLRVRSLSTDCTPTNAATTHSNPPPRARRSLSVHFAPSPVLTANAADSSLAKDLESLDLSGYMKSIHEAPASTATDEATATVKPTTTTTTTHTRATSTALIVIPATAQALVQAEPAAESTGVQPPVEIDAAPVDPVKVAVGKIEAVVASAKPLEGRAKSLNAVFGMTVA